MFEPWDITWGYDAFVRVLTGLPKDLPSISIYFCRPTIELFSLVSVVPRFPRFPAEPPPPWGLFAWFCRFLSCWSLR